MISEHMQKLIVLIAATAMTSCVGDKANNAKQPEADESFRSLTQCIDRNSLEANCGEVEGAITNKAILENCMTQYEIALDFFETNRLKDDFREQSTFDYEGTIIKLVNTTQKMHRDKNCQFRLEEVLDYMK